MQGAPAVAGSVLLDVFSIDPYYLVYWQRIRLTNQAGQAVPGKNILGYADMPGASQYIRLSMQLLAKSKSHLSLQIDICIDYFERLIL